MTFRKRMIAVVVLAAVVATLFGTGKAGLLQIQPKAEDTENETGLFTHKDTLYLWYTDEALTDYLSSVAVSYNEMQEDVRVIPTYTSGLEYLETINQASLNPETVPDLYLIANDALEKAYLAGLASEIETPEGIPEISEYFPDAAVRAVTYHEKQIGYPLYFETSSFLYNKTYLEEWAKTQIEAEADAAEGEAAQAAHDSGEAAESASATEAETQAGDEDAAEGEAAQTGGEATESASAAETEAQTGDENAAEGEAAVQDGISQEMIDAKVEEALPKTIDDILTFADTYDAPEQVEAVFKWDVSDIFYNYFFVGNYIDVGGAHGDNAQSIDIYNESAIRCMRVYQDLNQFFSIDTSEISYDDILQDFIDGKIVYTVATTDALSKIEAAKADGAFQYEYGTSVLPDVSDELTSKSLSVTQCIVVNGYSEKKEAANDFAVYLSCFSTDSLYDRTGKVSALKNAAIANPNAAAFIQEYEKSAPIPKMIETSNYWIEMEVAFAQIWDGNDANKDLESLSEKIMSQVAGQAYDEEHIDVPEEEKEIEDEDAGME